MKLTQERLKELLDYDPVTGIFRWHHISRGRTSRDGAAGCVDKSMGYVRIRIKGRRYMAHNLAWIWMTGKLPVSLVDHRDGDKANNKFANLRQATASQNIMNSKLRSDNKEGLKGARFKSGDHNNGVPTFRKRPYYATIKIDGRQRVLGYFSTAEEAHAAYIKKANEIFGEFARAK